jgi:hypothetical protein
MFTCVVICIWHRCSKSALYEMSWWK